MVLYQYSFLLYMNKKNTYIVVLVIALFLALFGSGVLNYSSKSYEIAGVISSVGDDYIMIDGFVNSQDGTDQERSAYKIWINVDTVINRVSISIPDTDEMFMIDDSLRQESTASLDILKNDFETNISSLSTVITGKKFKDSYRATNLEYRLAVYKALDR
jgi:hypothetical protein